MPANPDAPRDPSAPTFSVIWPYGGSRSTAAQCVASLEAQAGTDVELIFYDDDSSDGFAEILAVARQRSWRVELVPSGAESMGERLLDLLRNCRGDYIAFLPSEGRFRPQAFERAARQFERTPHLGGLCTRGFLVDAGGKALAQVDIVTLLLTTYRPFLPAGFIARRALVAVGLHKEGWFEGA